MEDPVRFDVWCTPGPSERDQAISDLLSLRPDEGELKLRAELQAAVNSASPLLTAEGLPWNRAQSFLASKPAWALEVHLFQEGRLPTEELHHCDSHNLSYGGVLGCHVCTGFYQRD